MFLYTYSPTLGLALVVLSLFLAAKNNPWTWLPAFVGYVILTLNFMSRDLYADGTRFLIFALGCGYGWQKWKTGGPGGAVAAVSRVALPWHFVYILAGVFTVLFCDQVLEFITGRDIKAYNFIRMTISCIAFLLLLHRKLESWIFWIIAKVLGILDYVNNGNNFALLAETSFLAASIYGLFHWNTLFKKADLTGKEEVN